MPSPPPASASASAADAADSHARHPGVLRSSFLLQSVRTLLRRDGSYTSLCAMAAAHPPAAGAPELEAAPPRRRRRILILMSDTGGGHRASADALKAALEALFPDQVSVAIVDFWVDLAGPPFTNFPSSYAFAAKHPPVWAAMYHTAAFPPTRFLMETAFDLMAADNIRYAFARMDPDLIVSVHPLVQELSTRVLNHLALHSEIPKTPFVTCVTDLGTAHPSWFHPQVLKTYVPSNQVGDLATSLGLQPQRVLQCGLPVRPMFWDRRPADHRPPSVLLLGGGDGVGKLEQIATALADKLAMVPAFPKPTLVVVCGKNKKLVSTLRARAFPVPTRIEGFVTQMEHEMAQASCLVTKAGPGTIAEALICGLPMVLSSYLPGQEKGNVDFVLENRVGACNDSPVGIADIVCDWLSNPEELAEMSKRALRLGKPEATLEIARDMFDVCVEWEDRRDAAKMAKQIRDKMPPEEHGFLLRNRIEALFGSIEALLGTR